MGTGDVKIGGDLKGPGVDVAVPSVAAPDINVGVKGPKVKGEVGVAGAQLEGPEVKLGWPKGGKTGLGLEMPEVSADVDVKLKGPQISRPELEGNLKGPKLKGDLDISGSAQGPGLDLGGLAGTVKLPTVKSPTLEVKGGVPCSVQSPGATLDLQGPSLDVSGPDLDVNLKGPKLKGDVGVKTPQTSAEDSGFEILGGTIKLPSLKLPQFSLSGPSVDGGDAGVTLEGPQVKGGLKGSGLALEGPEVELKGPKFSGPDVDLRLKGPNVDAAADIKAPKVSVEAPRGGLGAHLEAPGLEVSSSGLNVNVKGPKVKGAAEVTPPSVSAGSGTFHVSCPKVGAEGGQVKVSFPKLRMPKFVFSEPEAKGREVGVDVEFPSTDVAEPEPDEAEARLKKSKLKMPKFNFSKQKGRGAAPGSPEASGSVSGSKGDLKSSKVSLGSAEGELEAEAPAAKAKFSLFRSKKPRARSSSFSDEHAAEPDGAARQPKGKFGTFGGLGSKAKGCYEVTAGEDGGRAPGSPLSASCEGVARGGLHAPGLELAVTTKRKE